LNPPQALASDTDTTRTADVAVEPAAAGAATDVPASKGSKIETTAAVEEEGAPAEAVAASTNVTEEEGASDEVTVEINSPSAGHNADDAAEAMEPAHAHSDPSRPVDVASEPVPVKRSAGAALP
jgi:hypothetical protein